MDGKGRGGYGLLRSSSAARHLPRGVTTGMITDCRTDDCTVVQVSGELDIATAPLLHDHLFALIGDGHRIVLELGGVEFMDSSGLEVLLSCHSRAEQAGTGLVLRRPSRRVSRLLELTGLRSHFVIETVALPEHRHAGRVIGDGGRSAVPRPAGSRRQA